MASCIEKLENLIHPLDADLTFEMASLTAWSGALRLTLTDPKGAPSRSISFYTAGAESPEDAATVLLEEVESWLEDGGKPLPTPDWMKL